MIITCEECSTRFNLDESMIKAGGSKVRCSLCKHIFTVFPQVPEPPMAPEPEEEISFDPESYDNEIDVNIEFEEDELTFEDADLVFEETGSEQDLALLELEPSDDQHMTFPDLAMETKDPEASPKESELTLDLEEGLEPSSETHEENREPEDAFSSYDQVLDQDTEPEENFQDPDDITPYAITDDITGGEPIEKNETFPGSQLIATQTEEETTLDHPELHPWRPRKRKKRSGIVGPVMLLILLFILVAGAYIASMTLGYKIPYLSDVKIPILEKYLKKEMPQKAALKPIPNEGSVNGRFISNDTAGDLFIITGQIENPSTIPYSYLQVMGTLITKGKVKAKTLTTFCGNIISEETLKTGNIPDITKQLATREGAHNSNINVKPGGVVPFMIVFSDLPDNLENFTVEVVEL